MAFKRGNKLWQLIDPKDIGRNPKYTVESIWTEAMLYFEWVDNNPMTSEETTTTDKGVYYKKKIHKLPYTWTGLYVFLNVKDLAHYKTKEAFSGILKRIDYIMTTQKFSGAAAGLFKENIIARDLGLAEQTKNENNHTLPEWMNED